MVVVVVVVVNVIGGVWGGWNGGWNGVVWRMVVVVDEGEGGLDNEIHSLIFGIK